MKAASWTAAALVAMAVLGCQSIPLPDAYGVYATTNNGRLSMGGQQIELRGNLLSFVSGLKGPSGVECAALDNFIVFEKNVHPDSIGVTLLDFVGSSAVPEWYVRSLTGQSAIAANLWMPKEQVAVDIQPVSQHPDMYLVKPKRPLDKGFYALHIGRFAGDVASRPVVFDIVIGSAKDFPSFEAKKQATETETKKAANLLVKRMNEMFNASDYSSLDEVYRPDGVRLAGAKRDEFVTGSRTWRSNAGHILGSKISYWSAANDGSSAQGGLETTYDKSGLQHETIAITKLSGQFYITSMR